MFYRRRLPHWQPSNKAIFVTWRLHPSSAHQRWLHLPAIAPMIVASLHYGETQLNRYHLYAFVVMSNHVHVLIEPFESLTVIFRSMKSFTARQANALLRRTGEPFWNEESFDHWMRNETEFRDTVWYIEQNPVRAGLVERPEDFRWSSAWERVQETQISSLEAHRT